MQLKHFLLLSLICATNAVWTDPILLSDENSDGTFPEMYVDPLTKTTHAIWIENPGLEFKLAYMKIYYNKTRSPVQYLEVDHRPRLSQITGAGDGERIFVAYDAKRTQGDNNECNGGVSTGCYEIFFTESKDGGATWSKPVMIEHEDPQDVLNRKGPRMIYVKENKQVFITYWKGGPMAYSTRIGDYSQFSKEEVYPFGSTTAYQSIVYTLNEKLRQPIFHFIYMNWTFPEENMMYTQSKDMGRTWTTPKRLVYYKHSSTSDSFLRPFTVADHNTMKNSIFSIFALNNEAHVIWSHDNGETWSIPLSVHPGSPKAIAPRMQLCRNVRGEYPRLYILYAVTQKLAEGSYIFGSIDLKTHTYKDEQGPFNKFVYNWDYMIDCYEDGNKITVQAIAEAENEDINSIYLSSSDEKPRYLSTYAD